MLYKRIIIAFSLLTLSVCSVYSEETLEANLGKEINVNQINANQILRSNDVEMSENLLNASADGKCDCGPYSISCTIKNKVKICACKTGYAPGQYGYCVQTCNSSSTCKNGGSCLQHVCMCLPGTSGPFCETIDECVDRVNPLCDPKAEETSCQYDVETQRAFCYCHIIEGRYDVATAGCKVCECNAWDSKDYDAWYDCHWGPTGEKKCFCTEGHAYDPTRGICSDCVCGKNSKWCEFNQEGSKICVCKDGYKQYLLYGECEECDCGEHGVCVMGSVWKNGYIKCICDTGYTQLNGTCVECDCGKHGKCVFDDNGTQSCDCEDNYAEKEGKCEFCFCGDRSLCTFDGTNKVCHCQKGYEAINGFCIDINECKHNICGVTRNCINTLGSYKCECKEGYQLKVEETILEVCEDINECQDSKICTDSNTECMNTPGSYKCVCKSGFASRGDVDSITYCEKTANWTIYTFVVITATAALIISMGAGFYAKQKFERLTRRPGRYELR